MKAKVKSNTELLTRYEPSDPETYPEVLEDGIDTYYRFYCRPLFIVYEQYRNGIKIGYYILPTRKEVFTFNGMIDYVEKINSGETLCQPMR